MSSLQAFFAQNVQSDITEDFIVSERFKDDKGNPIPWKLRTVSEAENAEIRKSATKRVRVKGQGYTPELDHEDYVAKLIVSSVVFPDLKHAELQKSYNVIGASDLLKKMLISGEYGRLAQKIQGLNGFNDINELVDEIKN